MDGIFYFGEHYRWNLGWSNPNQSGAFVVMWLPLAWLGMLWDAHSKKAHYKVNVALFFFLEMANWFLLSKTYSRGALVAALVAVFAHAAITKDYWKIKTWWVLFFVRILSVILILIATGFAFRIEPQFVSNDASAGNRITLWKGGLQMIALAPWSGWGSGQSGRDFSQWFQPLSAKEEYAGMVNSYLHITVEHGIVVLFVLFFLAGSLVIFSLRSIFRGLESDVRTIRFMSHMEVAFLLVLVVFAVANLFSTLWIFSGLLWQPGASVCFLIVLGFIKSRANFFRPLGKICAISLIIAVGICGSIILVGRRLPMELEIGLKDQGDSITVRSEGSHKGCVVVFPDDSVLGRIWGKEIRRLAVADDIAGISIQVPRKKDSGCPSATNPRVIVACGEHWESGLEALKRFPDALLVLVHPLGKPDGGDDFSGRIKVLLPALDTRGGNRRWKAFCKARGWSFSETPQVGQDIRLMWPDALFKVIGDEVAQR